MEDQNSMIKAFRMNMKRWISILLAFALVITNIQIPAFAADGYQSYLDGWCVQAAWNTLNLDYTWNAKEAATRQPKIVVTYRMNNAKKEYPAGSLTFTIPGIGAAGRMSMAKASKLAADQADSEWNYTWDPVSDIYTFSNRFDVKTGQSVSGGFELLWTLNARHCENGFHRTESPTFSVSGAGSIRMDPLSYAFTSIRDRYRISFTKRQLHEDEYDDADQAYTWYYFRTRFDTDYLARGLYRSNYFISVELPNGAADEDVIAKYNGRVFPLERNADGALGFYPFKDRPGDVTYQDQDGNEITHYEDVLLGFRQTSLNGQEITVKGHMDRLYQDEEDWVTTAGEHECVDVEDVFTVTGYRFNHHGYIYGHDKYNFDYERLGNTYFDRDDHSEPKHYSDRFPATGLYDGKVVEFNLYGLAKRDYGSLNASYASLEDEIFLASLEDTIPVASASDAEIITEPALMDWNDMDWKLHGLADEYEALSGITYGELHPTEVPVATASDADSIIDEDQELSEEAEVSKIAEATQSNAKKLSDHNEDTRFLSAISGFLKRWLPDWSVTAYAAEQKMGTDSNLEQDHPYERVPATSSNVRKTDPSEAASDIMAAGLLGETPKNTTKPGGNQTGHSQIQKDQEYSLIMGDDMLAVTLLDGSMRALEDEEYDMVYITVPATAKAYDYEIFGTDTRDTHFDEFVLLDTGNTKTASTVVLPDGIKNVFIRVNKITGTYAYYAKIGVRLHLDWANEREKASSDQVNRDGKAVNFSYLRALYIDEDGYEVNDCALEESNYEQDYGKALAERDMDTYQEYLLRDYSNVWLRNPITNLTAEAEIKSVEGNGKTGFTAAITGEGTIQSDNSGTLKTFSLYVEIPSGMSVDLDNMETMVAGSGTLLGGSKTTDFQDHVTLFERDNNKKHYVVADFDFSDAPLNAAEKTTVSCTIPVTLSYANYISYGNSYRTCVYLMPHDDGLDQISGSAIRSDAFDLDENGSPADLMAYATDVKTILDDATEWREFVSKYIKSAYSTGFVTDTVTRLYSDTDSAQDKEKSEYQYRLDFGLGSSNAKNIIFFDRIEQGAEVVAAGKDQDTKQRINSAWQGNLVSVDTSQAKSLGLEPTIYYSTNASQPFDLTASGWSMNAPSDLSAVKSVAIALDTSNMEDGVMKTKQMAYVLLNMRAPADRNLIEKKAVNQYTVQYDAYGLTNQFEETYLLPSSETYVRLLDRVGKAILQKVDADNVTRIDENGTKHYASLTGAKFQVYDSTGKALFEEGGKEVNALGRIVLNNVRQGMYYWEETKAPTGYEKISGRHAFLIDGVTTLFPIENKRIPGSVTLTKRDADDETKKTLAGAEFSLYQTDGTQVFVSGNAENYTYSEASAKGKNSCITGTDGTLTVAGLPWGSYFFMETAAPVGYQKNDTRLSFEIGKDQYAETTDTIHTTVEALNEEKTASIRLTKTDQETGKALKNAYYDVAILKNGEYQNIFEYVKTNAVGELTVDGLKFGSYRFTEVMPPSGYKLASDPVYATLDASTAETTILIRQEDERKTGSVKLMKVSQDGAPLANAEFSLYRKGDTQEEDTLIRSGLLTGSDGTTDIAEGLSWGTYYFLETKAPQGYQKSDTRQEFTVDAETAGIVQTLKIANNRILGTVILTKMDGATKSQKLADAHFRLCRNDGSVVKAELTTGTDGTVTVNDLDWGSYYFEEIKAPSGYGLNPEKIRFSVNEANCTVTQNLICYDPTEQVQIKIHKEINDWHAPFGNATFLFLIQGTDINNVSHSWTKSVTLEGGNLHASVIISGIPSGTYTIRERNVERYKQERIVPVKNVIVSEDGMTATAVLTTEKEAEITFENNLTQYEKFSHTTTAVNLIDKTAKLTGMQVVYQGDAVIESETESSYTFTANDLNATVFYDDGTSRELSFSDLSLNPATVTGNHNSSGSGYTVTVSYTENGITVTDSFSVMINLQVPSAPFTVTYRANGGYFDDDTAKTTNQVTYETSGDDQVVVTKGEEKTPNHVRKKFAGWYTDQACLTGSEFFAAACTEDVTVYAKWEEMTATLIDSSYNSVKTSELKYLNQMLVDAAGNPHEITAFLHSAVKPTDAVIASEARIISTEASEAPIYLWRDGTALKWWSKAEHVNAGSLEYLFGTSKIDFDTNDNLKDTTNIFVNLSDIRGLSDWDISQTDNLSRLFQGCAKLTDLTPICDWNTAMTTNMESMFAHCTLLTDLSPISGWNTKQLQAMSYLFRHCTGLTSVSPLAGWNTDKVTTMRGTFAFCKNLTDLSGLASWDTSKMTDMYCTFRSCENLQDLTPLSGWNTKNVTNAGFLFSDCTSLVSLTALTDWNMEKVTTMQSLFQSCKNLTDLTPLSGWQTGLVSNMSNMFYHCSGLTSINPLTNWNTEKVTQMSSLFSHCTGLTDIRALAGWNTSRVRDMRYLFYECNMLENFEALSGWDTGNVTDMGYLFDATKITSLTPLTNWNTGKVTAMDFMFASCRKVTDLTPLSTWDTGSVTNLRSVFTSCEGLTTLAPIANWNTKNATTMSSMFYFCTKLADTSPINDWEIGAVTSFERMFYTCPSHPEFTKRKGTWDNVGTFLPAS